ncbi:MAG: hypothetical protein Q9226_006632 [Calogaya cf. arnoldii]
MPLYAGHNFQGDNEKYLYAAATSRDGGEPTFKDPYIAFIFQLIDWTAFRSFRNFEAQQAREEIQGKQISTVTHETKRYLQAYKKMMNEYLRILNHLSTRALDTLLYGYIRTDLSTEEIAQIMNREPLGLPQGAFNPLTAAMVEMMFDWVEENSSHKVAKWINLSNKDKKTTDMQEIFRIYFKLPEIGPPLISNGLRGTAMTTKDRQSSLSNTRTECWCVKLEFELGWLSNESKQLSEL